MLFHSPQPSEALSDWSMRRHLQPEHPHVMSSVLRTVGLRRRVTHREMQCGVSTTITATGFGPLRAGQGRSGLAFDLRSYTDPGIALQSLD